ADCEEAGQGAGLGKTGALTPALKTHTCKQFEVSSGWRTSSLLIERSAPATEPRPDMPNGMRPIGQNHFAIYDTNCRGGRLGCHPTPRIERVGCPDPPS